MDTILINLVGEQPAPNLIPVKALQPDSVILLHSSYSRSLEIASRLKQLLSIPAQLHPVEDYDIPVIQQQIQQLADDQDWQASRLLWNLTGGTKPMSIAAFNLASAMGSEMVYLCSEQGKSVLYTFQAQGDRLASQKIPIGQVITLPEHLYLYLGPYSEKPPADEFELAVFKVLQGSACFDEILTCLRPRASSNLEIDFVLRVGNQVAIAEAKQNGEKKGIDQLNSASEQRYLGTYVTRIFISGMPIHPNNLDLAHATRVNVIELTWNKSMAGLSAGDQARLVDEFKRILRIA